MNGRIFFLRVDHRNSQAMTGSNQTIHNITTDLKPRNPPETSSKLDYSHANFSQFLGMRLYVYRFDITE